MAVMMMGKYAERWAVACVSGAHGCHGTDDQARGTNRWVQGSSRQFE